MSKFTERLWQDLRREHGDDLVRISGPGPGRNWRGHPRLLAGTGLGVAVAGTLAALVLSAASSAPAFAVTRNPDGTVSVVITRVAGLKGANATLAALGLRARFVQVTASCAPRPPFPPGTNHLARPLTVFRTLAGGGWVHAQIDPRKIPAGQVLVVPAGGKPGPIQLRAINLRAGVPACLPMPFLPERLQTIGGNSLGHCVVGPPAAARLTPTSPTPPPGDSGEPAPPALPKAAPATRAGSACLCPDHPRSTS